MSSPHPVLRFAAVVSSAALLVVGALVIDLQGRREDGGDNLVGYGVGTAFVAGSLLCLVALLVWRRRGVLLVGAALLTAAVSVPSLVSAAYPLVLVVWAFAWASRATTDRSR